MKTDQKNIKIIIATHKKYQMPEDRMYIPVHVGAEGKIDGQTGEPLNLGYQKDNEGDNISKLNAGFCELTGLYYAWKNIKSDYLGLVHYRRYFMLKAKGKEPFQNILTAEEASQILQDKRVIVPKQRNYYIETLYSHYAHTHHEEHLITTRSIIADQCPEYLESFDSVMKRTHGYMFNMMIMEHALVDSYCTWLFEILFALLEREKESSRELSAFQGRLYGRVSELLFNVWIDQMIRSGKLSQKDIIEIPCIYMEKINWTRKIKSFLLAKFFHKKYEGSF